MLLIYLNFSYILLRLLSLRFACFCRCVRFLRPAFLRALRCLLSGFEGKRGATRGKRPWVFSPRAFRADECGRMHSRSALPEKFLEIIVLKNINIFREIALPERWVELVFLIIKII